ncbi:DUF3307 domain-containing protein [Pectobacterium carotovorum]|uniref:DUF3307 domain-containing protein n=1 Tax=Pectobacterium carotovorum TaxID=554 RepID=UPI0021C414B0|nr:DUF3307 domain-containing protein [Pectobacterium carotovorum]
MFSLIFYVLLAHIIADFYLQSYRMVEKKAFKNGKLNGCGAHLLHIVIHGVVLIVATYIWLKVANVSVTNSGQTIIVAIACVCFVHLVTDLLKLLIPADSATADFWSFMLDQAVHIGMLVWMVYWYLQPKLYIPRPPSPEPDKIWMADIILLLCGLTFLLKPTSLTVSKFLNMAMADTRRDRINITKSHLGEIFYQSIKERLGKLLSQNGKRTSLQVDKVLNESKQNNTLVASRLLQHDPGTDVSENFPSNQAGKWIGYTERTMIFFFFLSGQYTAIAAVVALKTAFRFNDLKDDNDSHRSEYIMIGTFVSFFITVATAALIRHVLTGHSFGQVSSVWLKSML